MRSVWGPMVLADEEGQRHSISVILQQSPIDCKHLVTATSSTSLMYLLSHRRKSANEGGREQLYNKPTDKPQKLSFLLKTTFGIGSSTTNRPYLIILTVINSINFSSENKILLFGSSIVSDLLFFLYAH